MIFDYCNLLRKIDFVIGFVKTTKQAKTILYQKKLSVIDNVLPQRQYIIDNAKQKITNSIENSRIAYIFVQAVILKQLP